jgi:hypothetical protein
MSDKSLSDTREYNGPDRRTHQEPLPLPVWIKAIVALGVPGAIAMYVVWVGSNELPRLFEKVAQVYEVVTRVELNQGRIIDQIQANYRMSQRICANTAKTHADQQRCFDK